jgi:hypothetical protein
MSGNRDLQQASEAPAEQPGLRFLEMAVYIMGGLLVLMFIGLVVGIAWKITHKPVPQSPATWELNLGLSSGESVTSVQVDGDRLVVTTANQIIVLDVKQNAVLSRISLTAK